MLSFNITDTSVVKIFVKSVMSNISGIKLELVSNTQNETLKKDNKYEALEKLYNLKNKYIISEEEYEKEKNKIIKGE